MAYIEGRISAVDDLISLKLQDHASARISIEGDFDGVLEVVGVARNGPSAVYGPRLLMKAGNSQIGTHRVENDGSAFSGEYLCSIGGQELIIRAVSWNSGSAFIAVDADHSPSAIFILGSVLTDLDLALRAKRAYLASTQVVSVPANNALHMVLSNPSDSDVNAHVYNRWFRTANANTDDLEFQAYVNPTVDTSAWDAGSVPNTFIGGPASPITFKFKVDAIANITMGGTQGSGDFIPLERPLKVIIPPGFSLGFVLLGAGTNVVNAARLVANLDFFLEPTG